MKTDPSGTFTSLTLLPVTPPFPHWDRIWKVWYRVLRPAQTNADLGPADLLRVLGGKTANADARSGMEVGIHLGLSELISDSELAFIVGQEPGHIYQQRFGRKEFHHNPEFDADLWGVFLAMAAGHDPYAAAGALAKLAMATGRAGLIQQFEEQMAPDAHKSFNTRRDTVYETLIYLCSLPEGREICAGYKEIFHPHLPDGAPLSLQDWEARGHRQPSIRLRVPDGPPLNSLPRQTQ